MMWLLDTTSLALSAFFDNNTPYYAILSHTWGLEEVSFQDIQGPHERIVDRAGYKKIKECCAKALEAGFKYVWIDTCCIDKTNSVELSEAINTMFRWYRNSITCYAYLADVTPNDPFAKSRWFRRGWTLQELIAPSDMLFFDKYWNEIGSRESLRVIIEEVTGIPQRVLLDASPQGHCIAEIMSWAARRKTTRLEDRAYSLLGLFGVSMPLIYGEGEQAFTRLQLEIMKTSTDHSLFAWTVDKTSHMAQAYAPQRLLAPSPDEFKSLGGVLRSVPNPDTSAYEMTNLGLRITLPCSPPKVPKSPELIIAHLNCKVKGSDDKVVGICLDMVRRQDGQYVGQFCRIWHHVIIHTLDSWNRNPKSTSLYIIQPKSSLTPSSWSYGSGSPKTWSLDYSDLFKAGYLLEAYSAGHKDSQVSHQKGNRITFVLKKFWGSLAFVIFFKHLDRAARVWVAICFDGGNTWAVVDGSLDMKDTPEVILKDHPLNEANKRWDGGNLVEHTLPKTVFEDETLTLTVKRAIFSDQVGFMMRIAVLDHKKQELVEYHLGSRPEKRILSLRDFLCFNIYPPRGDAFGALVKIS